MEDPNLNVSDLKEMNQWHGKYCIFRHLFVALLSIGPKEEKDICRLIQYKTKYYISIANMSVSTFHN